MNFLIGTYNNYFNRTIKQAGELEDYINAMEELSESPLPVQVTNMNFNPNDGITTKVVLGKGSLQDTEFMNWDLMSPDYLVAYGDDDAIISRWFILDAVRTRGGQYELSLRRDVVIDNIDAVLDATTYVEKGQVSAGNNLIFNKEGMLFNQIKQSEDQLKDASGCAWLVGYIAKNASATNVTVNYDPADQNVIKVSASNIDNWFQSLGISAGQAFKADPYDISYRTAWQAGTDFVYHYACRTYVYGTGSFSSEDDGRWVGNDAIRAGWYASRNEVGNALLSAYNSLGLSAFKAALIELAGCHSSAEVTNIKNFDGKTIKTNDGKYYRISVKEGGVYSTKNASLVAGNNLYNLMSSAVVLARVFGSYTTPDSSSFKYSFKCSQYVVTASEDVAASVKASISSTRLKTNDGLFDIIAMPYPLKNESVKISYGSGSYIYVNNTVSMAAMTALATTLVPGQGIYDIQLLPYCPVQRFINSAGGGLTVDPNRAGSDYDWILDGSSNDAKIGIVFYVPESQFTFDINKSLYWNQYRVIDGFTDLSDMPAPYNNFQPNVSYVLKTAIYQTPFNTCSISTGNYNRITFNKINKRTGEVVDTMQGSSVTIVPAQQTYAMVQCSFKPIEGSSDATTPWNWGTGSSGNPYIPYDLDDVYLEIIINTSDFTVTLPSYVKQLVKQPVFNSEINGAYAMKIDNECNLYRVVSPNYQGEFEFSPVKNGGVDRFNVDCTYKPYNPYIHVNPDFGGLYGDDYNDSRGLICQGDFTVGMISDAFTTYELNNKNYQQIFNRQIQNMDVSNEIARAEQGVKSVTGTITGAVGGAVAGGMVGGGYGAAAGAILGFGAGVAGGIADYYNLDKQLKENKSYAADMYNFSLQNIKALPYTLTRCTALTFNNKLFPFIEYYTCTDEEKEAFIRKLQHDGMTVNAIDKIRNYTDQEHRFVRGAIIRFDQDERNKLHEDTHMASEIYDEIKKGVYI